MRTHVCLLGFGAAALALVHCLLSASSGAADEKEIPEVKAAVLKLTDAVEKDDAAGVKRQLEELKKTDVEDLMGLSRLRSKGGLGVGPAPGVIRPDGIDLKLLAIGKKAPTTAELAVQSADLARMAYVLAAVAEAIHDKCPVAVKTGPRDPKEWKQWSEDMGEQAKHLAKVLKEKKPDPMVVKTAATKLYGTCAACHGPYR